MDDQQDYHHHRVYMNPLLIGLLGVFAGAIVVAICHCIIVFCNDTQRLRFDTINDNVTTTTASTMAQHPTVQVIVQSKEYKEDVCSICLGEFKLHERVRVLPECVHVFHVTCIDKWLEHHSSCPLCRASALHPPLVIADFPTESDGIRWVPATEIDRISGFGGDAE